MGHLENYEMKLIFLIIIIILHNFDRKADDNMLLGGMAAEGRTVIIFLYAAI